MKRGDGKAVKFSDGLFLDKETANMKKKINKLSTNTVKVESEEIIKIQKQLVDKVIDNPDFKETVNSLSTYTDACGSDAEKGKFETLKNKIKTGSMEYNDIQELYTLSHRTYKHFFKTKPSLSCVNPTAVIGFFITLVAIIIRCCGNKDTNIVLMYAINICAIIFTTVAWPNVVRDKLYKWTDANGVPRSISDKLISPVVKKTWRFVVLFIIVPIVILLLVNQLVDFSLGNDILSIISLSTAVLSDNIVIALVNWFQWRIYYNKER
ncbi:MAG: hypothetical protein IKB08_07945 [Clostridia bacterium]|nr:hypothetical protein [Clostridia bacterium]